MHTRDDEATALSTSRLSLSSASRAHAMLVCLYGTVRTKTTNQSTYAPKRPTRVRTHLRGHTHMDRQGDRQTDRHEGIASHRISPPAASHITDSHTTPHHNQKRCMPPASRPPSPRQTDRQANRPSERVSLYLREYVCMYVCV
mmetsp:Transcript_27672/g.79603  ORF Transcript_27672/g.79603 Transcript_27672/m.79603 type:complete len:143 (-) Transcript_27672:250-678(-)